VHAHGIEQQVFPYAVVSGFIIGLMAASICTFRHISIWKALLPSFGIYLIILPLGSFLIIGEKVLWSEIGFIVVFVVFFGILFGLVPLTLGIVGMSFILNLIIKIIKASKKTGAP
jgi:hypothetical protein